MPTAHSAPPLTQLLQDASVLETIPASICLLDAGGRAIAASRRLLEYTGATLEDFRSWDAGSELVHPDDVPVAAGKWARALKTGEYYQHELRMRRADGQHRWQLVEASALRDQDGNVTHWVSVLVDVHDRKLAEESVRRNEQLLQLVTGLLPANLAYIDRDERYTFANESYRAFYGIEPSSLIGKKVRDFIGDRVYAQVEPAIRKALCGEVAEVEIETTSPDGGRRFLHARNVPDFGPDGDVRGYVSLVTDVTAQRQAAEAQEQNAALTRLVADRVPALIALVDQHERYRFVNATFQEWFGIDPDAAVGTQLEGVLGPVYPKVKPYIERALAGEAVEFEVDFPNRRGGTRFVRAHYLPLAAPGGGIGGFVALVQDISAERRAGLLADEHHQRLQLLADVGAALNRSVNTAEMARDVARLLGGKFADIVTVDVVEDERIRRLAAYVNERVHVSNLEALVSTPVRRDDDAQGVTAALASGEAQYWPELPADPKDFARDPEHHRALIESRAISGIWAPIHADGETTGVLGLLRVEGGVPFDRNDLEFARELAWRIEAGFERATLTNRLQHALEAKDSFIGFVSHELKSPLTALLGFSDVFVRRIEQMDAATVRDIAQLLLNETRRLDEIIENMLMLARSERGAEDEPVLVRRIVPRVVEQHRWRYGKREVNLHFGGDVGPVLAPNGWIEQVVENLVSNAEKYSPPDSPIDIDVHTQGNHVTVRVMDRGRGITEEQARDVFEPFVRASPRAGVGGIGLGLTVCKKLTERLGGEIWLKPRDGGGTEAGFRLPTMSVDEE